MTRNIILSIAFVFVHLSLIGQDVECARNAKFGTADICLPKIKGYTECYLEPLVKQLADATEAPINEVLGYYINDSSYENLGSEETMDNFFKIYGTKEISNLEASQKEIEEVGSAVKGSFVTKNWELDAENILKDNGIDIEVGVPTVVKSYELNPESFTMIMIIKYELAGYEPYDMCIAMNGFLSNDRMVWMAYYLLFEGEQTIKQIELKSNEILTALQKAG